MLFMSLGNSFKDKIYRCEDCDMKYLISACLANLPVRYDGKGYYFEKISELLQNQQAITVCPEILGGLATPRLAAEIVNGTAQDVLNGIAQVIDSQGNDVTQAFIDGAQKALEIAKKYQVSIVVLKENSPSCGSNFIYDGTFSGTKISGLGITASLLRQHDFQVISEDDFLKSLD